MYVRPWINRDLKGMGCPCAPGSVGGGLAGLAGLGAMRPAPQRAPVMPRVRGVRGLGNGIPISVQTIRDGQLGTRDTIKEMARLSVAAAHDPAFVSWMRGQVADLPSKDYKGEAERIFDIVHTHCRYVRDPLGLEVLQDPRAVLFQDGSSDCDEQAGTVAAMAIALGHHAAFRTVAADPSQPDQWSHVYALIGVDNPYASEGVEWWAADTTQRNATLGWEPPDHRISMKKDWIVF